MKNEQTEMLERVMANIAELPAEAMNRIVPTDVQAWWGEQKKGNVVEAELRKKIEALRNESLQAGKDVEALRMHLKNQINKTKDLESWIKNRDNYIEEQARTIADLRREIKKLNRQKGKK